MNGEDEVRLRISDIQRFCMHDGPGLRTTVFLKGCPLSCQWCHNPETKSAEQQVLFDAGKCLFCGACAAVCRHGAQVAKADSEGHRLFLRENCVACGACAEVCPTGALEMALKWMTVPEVVRTVLQDAAFYGTTGGVTLSGGEPMYCPEATMELIRQCRAEGLNVALDTSGYFDARYLPELVRLVDTFLWDFKDGNDERHRLYTGVSNRKIIRNLRYADELGARTILRCIMVRGVNLSEDHVTAIAQMFHSLRNIQYVELLAYHAYAGSKMRPLGLPDNGRPEWIPSDGEMEAVRAELRRRGVLVKSEDGSIV